MNKQAYEHTVGLVLRTRESISKSASVWDDIKQHFKDNSKHYLIGSAVGIPSMLVGGKLLGKPGVALGASAGAISGLSSKVYSLYEDNKNLRTYDRHRQENYNRLSDRFRDVQEDLDRKNETLDNITHAVKRITRGKPVFVYRNSETGEDVMRTERDTLKMYLNYRKDILSRLWTIFKLADPEFDEPYK